MPGMRMSESNFNADLVAALSSEFKSRSEFKKAHPKLYSKCQYRGILDDVLGHLPKNITSHVCKTQTEKCCTVCGEKKQTSEFSPMTLRSGTKSFMPLCKICNANKSKKFQQQNPEKIAEQRKRNYWENRDEQLAKVKSWALKNPEKVSQRSRLHYAKNKDQIKKRSLEWYEANKDHVIARNNFYMAKRYESDGLYRTSRILRNLIRTRLKTHGVEKKCRTTEILGADIKTVRAHIESKFISGMSWSNHGEWHIDHIIPASWAKTESELLELNHYKNLQPLWAKENISKGNRYAG